MLPDFPAFEFQLLFYITFLNFPVNNIIQVSHIDRNIPDFKKRNLELLFSESNVNVLRVMEEFEVNIMTFEHM